MTTEAMLAVLAGLAALPVRSDCGRADAMPAFKPLVPRRVAGSPRIGSHACACGRVISANKRECRGCREGRE
jgi:hypothetical protein